jgi:hypothetical protein
VVLFIEGGVRAGEELRRAAIVEWNLEIILEFVTILDSFGFWG